MRGFKIDNTRQQLQVTLINRDISEESAARPRWSRRWPTCATPTGTCVFAHSAVDVARRALELADKLVDDNQARVEVGTLAPLDIVQAQAEAATRRQTLAAAEATASTAELALKRFLVSGTDDPLWRQAIRPVDLPSLQPPPTDIEGAVRTALAERTDVATAAQEPRQQRRHAAVLPEPVAAGARPQRQLRRAGPGRHAVHPRGHRRSAAPSSARSPAATPTRSRAARRRDYPDLEPRR